MYDSHSGSTPGWRHPRLQTGTNLIKYIFQTLISHLVGATTKQKGTTAVADGWCFLILISVLFLFSGFGGVPVFWFFHLSCSQIMPHVFLRFVRTLWIVDCCPPPSLTRFQRDRRCWWSSFSNQTLRTRPQGVDINLQNTTLPPKTLRLEIKVFSQEAWPTEMHVLLFFWHLRVH